MTKKEMTSHEIASSIYIKLLNTENAELRKILDNLPKTKNQNIDNDLIVHEMFLQSLISQLEATLLKSNLLPLITTLNALKDDQIAFIGLINQLDFNKAPTHDKHPKKNITAFWLLIEAVLNDKSEVLMTILNAFKYDQAALRKWIMQIDFNKAPTHDEHSNKNITAFWLLVDAVLNDGSDVLMPILNAFKHDQAALRKWIMKIDFNKAPTHDEHLNKNITAFWLRAEIALNGKPEALMTILNAFKYDQAALREWIMQIDFNKAPTHDEHLNKNITAFWLLQASKQVLMPILNALKYDQAALREWIMQIDFNKAPTHDEHSEKNITAFWLLVDAVLDDEPEALMAILNAFQDKQAALRKWIMKIDFNKAPTHDKGKDKNITAFWLLAKAVCTGEPEALMTILNAFENDQAALRKWIMKIDFNKAPTHEEHSEKNITAFSLLVGSLENKPQALMTILNAFEKDQAALRQWVKQIDFNNAPNNDKHPNKNITVFWVLVGSLVDRPEALMTILNAFENDQAALREWITQIDFNKAPNNDKKPNKNITVFWLLAEIALDGKPEALMIILNAFKGDQVALRKWITQIKFNKAPTHDEHSEKNITAFWLLAETALNGKPKPLSFILSAFKDEPVALKAWIDSVLQYSPTRLTQSQKQYIQLLLNVALLEAEHKALSLLDYEDNEPYRKVTEHQSLLTKTTKQLYQLTTIMTDKEGVTSLQKQTLLLSYLDYLIFSCILDKNSAAQIIGCLEKCAAQLTAQSKIANFYFTLPATTQEQQKEQLLQAYIYALKLTEDKGYQRLYTRVAAAYVNADLGGEASTNYDDPLIGFLFKAKPGCQQSPEYYLNSISRLVKAALKTRISQSKQRSSNSSSEKRKEPVRKKQKLSHSNRLFKNQSTQTTTVKINHSDNGGLMRA